MSAKKKTNPSKAAKIREFSPGDIQVELGKVRQELLDLRLRNATGQLAGENPLRLRTLRRQAARLITVAAQKKSATAATA
ncbi:MAG: 50S ribosomal protein L29 [Puniceicoccales bacterium]|jgi:ribosomal protein L29|nr:50S ribosomal protein L29 [Puniceicoccales bacterium]